MKNRIFAALLALAPESAVVRRDGQEVTVPTEDIRKGEKNLRLVAHQTPGAKEYGLSWAMQLHFEGKLRWVAFPKEF